MKTFDWQQEDNEYWKDTETLFQEAWDKGDNDTVWKCVNRVSLAMVKKKLVGLKLPEEDVYDMATDVTIIAIDRMRRKGKCDKLTSYLFWIVVGVVYDPKKKFNDMQASFDEILEKTFIDENNGECENEESELEI